MVWIKQLHWGRERRDTQPSRCASAKCWLWGTLLVAVSCADASPCDRVAKTLTPARRANLSMAVAGQLQSASAKVLRAYRLGNWHLLYVDAQGGEDAFLIYRGDPLTQQYIASWSSEGAKSGQSELRSWARMNARGIPETLAKCFAWSAASSRRR